MSIETPKGGAPCAAAIIDGTISVQAAVNNIALMTREVRKGERELSVETADKVVVEVEQLITQARKIEKLLRHEGVSAFGKPKS